MALVSLGYRWANAVRCEEGQGAAGARSYDGAGRTGFALGVLDRRPGVGLLVQVAEVELGAAVVVPAAMQGGSPVLNLSILLKAEKRPQARR